MRHVKFFLLAVLLLIPATITVAQDGSGKAKKETKLLSDKKPSDLRPGADQTPQSATDDPNYAIGPDDEVSVNVWKEPDVSRTVSVRPDGKISLPLLNDIQAAGLTPMQLSSEISERLKKFIEGPQVTIIITKSNSQRVFILGEVTRAGAYALLPNMTMLQALSSAGGFTQFANLKKIYVLRTENGKQTRLLFNYKEVVSGRRTEQNISLKPGDTIVVP
ncbi:MAG TPA: polysaccharide biosynthesis/export family protein [Candidatus Dormibacteraeota bacterium]|nr:polysaccharide biosynthesis/export family protein [Candidatus Dormibacteraeota bacterium]